MTVLFALLATTIAFAQPTSFRVLGVQGQTLLEQSIETAAEPLGRISDSIFKKAVQQGKLRQYQGSVAGVSSINDLGSALEVLSDTQMNAYGWCYRVDGQVPTFLAEQYQLTGHEISIEWFYAYAHLDRNNWKAMCVPADHVPVEE